MIDIKIIEFTDSNKKIHAGLLIDENGNKKFLDENMTIINHKHIINFEETDDNIDLKYKLKSMQKLIDFEKNINNK